MILNDSAHRFPNVGHHSVTALQLQKSFGCFCEEDFTLTINHRHGGIMKSISKADVEFLHKNEDRAGAGEAGVSSTRILDDSW